MDYRMQGQFPMAAVIQAFQQQPILSQELQAAKQRQLQSSLTQAAQGIGAYTEARRRLAAAMTMAQNPAVQQAMGAGQSIPGTGSVDAEADQQIASGPGGISVTPGMTAQGGPGMAPVQNTPMQKQPPMSPQQIQSLLPQNGDQDYMGDIQKMSNLGRLQKAFQAKGTVVTPIVGANGQISYSIAQVQPGATVQHPVRMPPPAPAPSPRGQGGQGGMTPNQRRIQQMTSQYKNLQGQLATAYGPQRDQIIQQMAPLQAQINQGLNVPTGTPGANMTTSSPMPAQGNGAQAGSIDPNVKALLDQHGVRYSPANVAWAQQKLGNMNTDNGNQ